jgi:hypothetical protein
MIHFLRSRMSRVFVLTVLILTLPGFLTKGLSQTVSTSSSVSSNKKTVHSGNGKKDSRKKTPVTHLFKGILEKVDLRDHPMTMTAMRRRRTKIDFVWDLTPQTIVFNRGKSVGVKSLKKGEKVLIFYQKASKKLLVVKVRILVSPKVLTHHH